MTEQNLNTINDDSQTPLHYALELGHAEIAHLLLDRGAEVNTRDKESVTKKLSNFETNFSK